MSTADSAERARLQNERERVLTERLLAGDPKALSDPSLARSSKPLSKMEFVSAVADYQELFPEYTLEQAELEVVEEFKQLRGLDASHYKST